MEGVTGKVAWVTGGASGIGRGIASALINGGFRVAISDTDRSAGQLTAGELGCIYFAHDVTDEAAWHSVGSSIVKRLGGLHVLVNNAGIVGNLDRPVVPDDIDVEAWRAIFKVNVEGVLLGCKTAIPLMRTSGGGSIVNIVSVAATNPTPSNLAYGASKAAVAHLTRSIAAFGARLRPIVRCNAVHPGQVQSNLTDRVYKSEAHRMGSSQKEVEEKFARDIPVGRVGLPADVASAVIYFASDVSQHVTGAALTVDGGENCRDPFAWIEN